MANPHTLGFSKDKPLDQLNEFVAQNEGFLHGPLIDMGNDGSQSLLTFDVGEGAPAKNAVIAPLKNGNPVVPPHSKVFIQNKSVFIAGVLTPSSASRPS